MFLPLEKKKSQFSNFSSEVTKKKFSLFLLEEVTKKNNLVNYD